MDRFPYTMFESEDSDIEEGPDVIRHKTKIIYQNTFPYIHMEPPDALYERWIKIKPEVKKAVGHMLHISVFWWHILFRQQENHTTTAWAVDTGFLDSNVSNDLSLKRLHRIEILELILNTMEKCLADRDPERRAKDLVSISTSFKMQEDCLAHAVSYLEESGPPGLSRKLLDLGRKELRYQILRFIFTEYARYVQVMSCSKTNMIRELTVDPELWCLQKSEEMKNKGNEQFQKKKYDLAVKWYTKAIKHHTSNHFLYGNRALAFIRCEKYLKAMGDGKRAIILQQDWAKGHYRFCDALFFLGAKEKAVEANLAAQSICSADPEGMRDLQQQYHRFMAEVFECKPEGKPKKTETKKGSSKRPEGACGMDTLSQHINPHKVLEEAPRTCTLENKESEDRQEERESAEKLRTGQEPEDNFKSLKDMKSEMAARRTKKAALCVPEKQSVKNKHPPAQEKPRSGSTGSADGCSSSGPSSKEQFCAAVLDAHTALYDQRCRNAQQAFSLALSILDSTGTKALGISELDRALLIYGYATAMIEIGQPEELGEAQRQFEKLSFSEDRKFQSLVLYGMGKVFLKENRFSKALEKFSNALLMVQRQITCGKLTWPTTKVTVEETRPEYLKKLLESSVEMCKFPPKPDAICRHQYCLGHTVQIYFTDPDFKGFIRMSCCQRCKVEFHISCWKKFKTSEFSDKNDKDFLQDSCFTPDCMGRICHIVIFGSTGLIKCEFEAHILKSKAPGKLRVRQPYTSLKKSKEDGLKLRRKQQRAPATLNEDETITIEEEANNKEAAKESPKDYTVHGDRVLHQIYESRELFKDELHSISSMLVCLRPWMELDEGKSHASVLKGRSEPQALWELVDVLLERRNRVWARVFIQILSGCQNIKPKLHDWAQQLDSVGLKAAESFIGHCGDQLEELDLSSLLAFPPLQDVLIEKFGTMPELFDNTGFTIIEYLKQAPPQEMRLFIWTLEENRERYPTCFTILDEYFEMDAICLVIKKTGIDNVSSLNKAKSKNRKKKQKEPKSVIFMSGMRSDFVRDEEDEDIFAEEDSFMLLDGNDPFSVPDHLRDQVAEFEGQYVSSGHLNYYKKFLDNNPDPTKESLYDYFEQILEEHGPLETSDPLLVGELENFPAEAQQKISAAGGLEPFLCESLRFYMMDNLIGLMGHAVSLQHPIADDTPMLFNSFSDTYDDLEPRVPSHLNPTAKEFLPQFEHLNVSDSNMSYDNDILDDEDIPILAHSDPQNSPPGPSALSNPCVFGSHITANIDYVHVSQDMDMAETAQTELQEVEYSEQLLISSPKDFIFNSTSLSPDNNINPYSEREARELYSSIIYKQANAAPESVAVSVQTLDGPKESREDAAVNTEPYLLFEKNKGDMTQKEKNNVKFEKQIQKMLQTYEYLQTRREEEVSVLEAEVEDYHQKVEITNKELSLFQQKLEEEIRKDQQEKRDNQEALKALKVENKELLDLQERLSKQIQDKNMEYQAELDCFLEISNQCEAEKMSLEEEIKRCRDRCAKAANRSQSAQLCILQNRRECGLRGLRKCLSDGKAILLNMTELSSRYPSSGLHSTIEAWKACVQEAEKKIARTEAQYEEQMELVSTGNRLESLPLISVPSAPAPPPVPALLPLPSNQHLVPQQLSVRHVLPHLAYAAQQLPAWPQSHSAVTAPQAQPAERTHSPPVPINQMPLQPLDVFEKIVNRLRSMFPHYSRAVLAKFIQEVRSASVSRFNMLTYEDMINRVAQLILDHQEDASMSTRNSAAPSPAPSPDSCRTAATPPPTHVWKNVSIQQRNTSKALNMEDPCIICHEEMAPEDVCVLECRHSFHRECIRSWLKEQSTCPTCREHALLPEDFPMLPGRHRRGHAPAASFS
ncbi:E3 ubiquitin-protein ligase TTC3 isoform X2 [Electrophorus electricus]|uniref:E3 ubiquitin-protein ligase TTC3 isoform X2 n=1 Tax=Electrophorus electricus TaxID=8005 RepID=UPI0015CFC72A|nr:E3 ubiquitin-protein ligase TTC3 isoform X2 [Electrophorus electricus]